MSKSDRLKKRTQIFEESVSSMKKVGTYREEFEPTVQRYADLRLQYEIISDAWYDGGCQVTEHFINKSGNESVRKTPEYCAIETLQKELTNIESILGLNPKGLKQLKSKGLDNSKTSKLAEVLASV